LSLLPLPGVSVTRRAVGERRVVETAELHPAPVAVDM
jgi:hypothetical protein